MASPRPCSLLLGSSDLLGSAAAGTPRRPLRARHAGRWASPPSRAAVMVARARSTPTPRRHCGGRPICTILPAGPCVSTIRLHRTGSVSLGLGLQPRQASPHCAAGSLLAPRRRPTGTAAHCPEGSAGMALRGSLRLCQEVAATAIRHRRTTSPAGSGPPQPGLTTPPPTRPMFPSQTCMHMLKRRDKG